MFAFLFCLARGEEATTKVVRDTMCARCKAGGFADGGSLLDPELGCVSWCSRRGYCGDGPAYRRGLDCRRALNTFAEKFGHQSWEQHRREWDHAVKFGPIISVRGERHCGTGWVRMMIQNNCPDVQHHWTPKLDSDGLYGWKHDFVPETFDVRSGDAMVLVFRSAVPWAPKMQRAAYSEPITRISRGSLANFVSRPFSERGRAFDNLFDLRNKKYSQYLRFLGSHRNVVGVRYEDLVVEPTFLFRRLFDLGFPCAHELARFSYVSGYAKFGTVSASRRPSSANRTWAPTDWSALLARIDHPAERILGYAYDANIPGKWYHFPLPPNSPLLHPSTEAAKAFLRRRRRRRR
ncbi:hypothetical protein CTAYLR_004903 [Chrysophaeum taylorii]|uniref:Uncharacterized protein n=1 Tax=Chrysophaeum taylorii TaxID=2483200 RepID=A0AAD7UQW4_9STRA|nr:hypothetical protein CTAYLR_004903 [Chrysophaeum taylorii]